MREQVKARFVSGLPAARRRADYSTRDAAEIVGEAAVGRVETQHLRAPGPAIRAVVAT